MKTSLLILRNSIVALLLLISALNLPAQGTAFTYQGRFTTNGATASGVVELQCTLWDALSGGAQVAAATPASTIVNITNGLFTVALDFGVAVFDGSDRYLQIEVRTTLGPYTLLTPRQKITATPYALLAGKLSGTLTSSGLIGTYGNAVTFSNTANVFVGNGAGLTALNASQLTGAISTTALSNAWKIGGNAGTTAGVNFLGTTDNQPLELKANGQRTLRLEPMTVTNVSPGITHVFSNAPNVIGGSSANLVDAGMYGSFVGGGGLGGYYYNTGTVYYLYGSFPNRISANYSTIVGGYLNTIQTGSDLGVIGGGYGNTMTNATAATIGGGQGNTIETVGNFTTIAGGVKNTIAAVAPSATIGGGSANTNRASTGTIGGGSRNLIEINATGATISGGNDNTVGSQNATVPGGRENSAMGTYSFAAGRQAKANHTGAFVWADSQSADFASTAADQFLIRAAGGVGIGTTTPGAKLEVGGVSPQQRITDTASGNSLVFQAGSGSGMKVTAYNYNSATAVPLFVGVDGAHTFLNGGGGNVAIGSLVPGFQLTLSTDSAGKPNGGSWANSSDARIKKNIQPLSGALDKLTQLRGVSFEWVNPADHANQTGRQAGFVAQEVERVFPNWVQEVSGAEDDAKLTPDGKIKSLSLPFEFDALTVEALRELRAENVELKKSVAELKELVNRLAAQQNGDAR